MISKSHTSPEKRNLVLKYSFSNVTGCLYCCLRSTKNWLWQLEFMYIHTVGGTQTTSEEVLLHLVKTKWNKTNWKKKKKKDFTFSSNPGNDVLIVSRFRVKTRGVEKEDSAVWPFWLCRLYGRGREYHVCQ